jgi:hypothetical protein
LFVKGVRTYRNQWNFTGELTCHEDLWGFGLLVERSVSVKLQQVYRRIERLRYPMDRRNFGNQNRSERCKK